MVGDRRVATCALIEQLVMAAGDPDDDEAAFFESRHDLSGQNNARLASSVWEIGGIVDVLEAWEAIA